MIQTIDGHRCKCNRCGSTLKHKKYTKLGWWKQLFFKNTVRIGCDRAKQKNGCLQSSCINYYGIKIYSMETRILWVEAEQISKRIFNDLDNTNV